MNKLPIKNVLKVLFDIKPVDNSGRVDVQKIQTVSSELDLRLKNKGLRSEDAFFFGTWDQEAGVRDLALINGKRVNQKAPTDAASIKLTNSVGAARNASPANHLDYSLSQTDIKSSKHVDNQKSRNSEIFESVEDRGFAPLDSQVVSRGRHYASPTVKQSYQRKNKKQNPEVEVSAALQQNKPKLHYGAGPAKLLEEYLNSKLSIKKELKAVGAKVEKGKPAKPRIRPILSRKQQVVSSKEGGSGYSLPTTHYESLDGYQSVLAQISERIGPDYNEVLTGEPKRIETFEYKGDIRSSPYFAESFARAQPEIENWVRYATEAPRASNFQFSIFNFQSNLKSKILIIKTWFLVLGSWFFKARNFFSLKKFLALSVVGFSAIIFTSFGQYGVSVKNEVIKESNLAVANLEQANESLRVFDFEAASNNFAEAYEEFSKAGDSLNFMGASITSLFAELPGAGKLKSAKNLVEAGKLLAEAGKSMSAAVTTLSKTSSILMMSNIVTNNDVRHHNIFDDLKKSLIASEKNLSKVNALLSEVSLDDLPEDKRDSFSEFQSKLPELENIVSDGVEYTSFLENLLGSNGSTKKYLVLFQNNSELRPTGGFPGTYAVVTFKDGRLVGFLVDDVYNLDGQLRENIIPPKQLQHITPNWGMRDANWFIDFSASAQKAMEFFGKEAGYEVDGVITMSPRMISEILQVVGPIDMPEYGYAITHENFLSTVQAEVEYGDNRQQPKQVVKDMAPRLLEEIYSAEPSQWLDIFNVFVSGLDRKDILMYFKDLNLERFAAEKGFGGLIAETDEDYLMVTFTNVKGSKTDRVTDNSIKLEVKFDQNEKRKAKNVKHKLIITRQHNGGISRYGFYNKQNPAYVRVLVPEGSQLLNISGNSNPDFKPLISYSGTDFKQDDNLFQFESGFYHDSEKGVSTYSESGKTGFAFWLITDPGKRKTVELEYAAPLTYNGDSYDIYIQKQPGLEVDNFEFQVGDAYIYNGEFDKDLELRFKTE